MLYYAGVIFLYAVPALLCLYAAVILWFGIFDQGCTTNELLFTILMTGLGFVPGLNVILCFTMYAEVVGPLFTMQIIKPSNSTKSKGE